MKHIITLECEIEIIGYWIYCFNAYEVREQLKALNFWFSSKHKAWIYSGASKSRYCSKATLNEIRASKGNYKVGKQDEGDRKSIRSAI